jgi:hypothetical protein
VLSMSGAEDPAAVAREWCFQQGTQDAQHIALVTQTLQTAVSIHSSHNCPLASPTFHSSPLLNIRHKDIAALTHSVAPFALCKYLISVCVCVSVLCAIIDA